MQLDHVDVTSAPFSGGTRELVRRYWLHYEPNGNRTQSWLTGIDLEGRCGQTPIAEDGLGELPVPTLTIGSICGRGNFRLRTRADAA
jgi:hypothetical protein